jgi:5-methylcytosine-specific restriction endonuclease McrA
MTQAIKTSYDTLTTNLHRAPVEKTRDYYLQKWKRRKGLLQRSGGGKIEKFRRISHFQNVSIQDILDDNMPRVFTSEYHFYRWMVGPLLCIYCGCRLHKDNRTQDHVVPRAHGGSQMGRDNLEPACQECNWDKGDLKLLVFLVDRATR